MNTRNQAKTIWKVYNRQYKIKAPLDIEFPPNDSNIKTTDDMSTTLSDEHNTMDVVHRINISN